MDANVFASLLQALPLHAEEDDLREEIPESELLDRMQGPAGVGVLTCVRRMFEACGLLDPRELAEGNWAFVSFAASLLAHSLMQTLATEGQQLFVTDYWKSTHNDDIEEQRSILKNLEQRRADFHPTASPHPIRFVYVAWGLVRLGDSFLLHHREDISRRDAKNYVLPGGRLRIADLPPQKRGPATLRELNQSNCGLAINSLPETLRRELREELGLRFGDDWTATPLLILNPYLKLEGARNANALTEYSIGIFHITLTSDGETGLLDTIDNNPGKFAWFNLDDMLRSTGRADGKRAFIDAIFNHFRAKDQIKKFIESTHSSSSIEYRFSTPPEAVELSASPGTPILVGDTGKEKATRILLSEDEHSFLFILGIWGKGLELEPEREHIQLMPGGWIKARSTTALNTLTGLQRGLMDQQLPLIQQVGECYARLSVHPRHLYFHSEAFGYRLSKKEHKDRQLTIELRLPESRWARNQLLATLTISLAEKMLKSLIAIESNPIAPGGLERFGYSDETMKKNCKEMLDRETKQIGLRKFVRISEKQYKISALQRHD